MDVDELKLVLQSLEPMNGAPPSWVDQLAREDLVGAARWIRTRLLLLERERAMSELRDDLDGARDREGPRSMLRRLFDGAISALGSDATIEDLLRWRDAVKAAEAAGEPDEMVQLWLVLLKEIAGHGHPSPNGPPGRASKQATVPVGAGTSPVGAIGPLAAPAKPALTAQVPTLIELSLRLVGEASQVLTKAQAVDDGQWGVDFGTAWSKVAFRERSGAVPEQAATTTRLPSIVAVERGGDRILFGEAASKMRQEAKAWNISTSLKRLLVGVRIDPPGMPNNMTTERMAVLYLAWALHHCASAGGGDSVLRPVQVSLPVVKTGANPELRQFFAGGPVAPRVWYREWMQRAVRLAQLIALTFAGRKWPESVRELLTVLECWDRRAWNQVATHSVALSEPAAVINDCRLAACLPDGITVLVDCGAGTTDVSVFLNLYDGFSVIAESSAVVGGDTLDTAITGAVLQLFPRLEEYRGNIQAWAREAKPELLARKQISFDPEVDLRGTGSQGGVSRAITLSMIESGLDHLRSGVERVVATAIDKADAVLGSAKPHGDETWPRLNRRQHSALAQVWYCGGSAAVAGVPASIAKAFASKGIEVVPVLLPVPGDYSSWSPSNYLEKACAVGVSRPSAQVPHAVLPDAIDHVVGVPDGDKDAG